MLLSLIILAAALFIILNLPVFGKLPIGDSKFKISTNPNYRDGSLQNITFTPVKPEDITYGKMMYEFFFW